MLEGRVDISVVVPCLNEEANLRPLAERFFAAAAAAGLRGEVVFVDDGSVDATWDVIEGLEREYPAGVLGVVVSVQREYKHFQAYIGVAAKAKGYSVVEVETLFLDRNAGTSFLAGRSTRVSLEVLADMPTALAEFGRSRHPHGPRVAPRSGAPAPARAPY